VLLSTNYSKRRTHVATLEEKAFMLISNALGKGMAPKYSCTYHLQQEWEKIQQKFGSYDRGY